MERDKFWSVSVPKELPYTVAALPFRHQSDLSFLCPSQVQDEAPVYMFKAREELRKASVRSLHSIVSSIKGAVCRRTHTSLASIWSSEAGLGSVIPDTRFLNSTPLCEPSNSLRKDFQHHPDRREPCIVVVVTGIAVRNDHVLHRAAVADV